MTTRTSQVPVDRFVADGRHREMVAAEVDATRVNAAQYEKERVGIGWWRRLWHMMRARCRIRAAVRQAAPRDGLYLRTR